MAQATGYRCDVCGHFDTADNPKDVTLPPVGWIVVTPRVKVDGTEKHPSFHLCSNRCLGILGVERFEAETGKRLVRQQSKKKS